MKGVESFFRDLVQDLRDRNLLIPAIVLLAAIVAVPVLLGAGGGSTDSNVATAPVDQGAPASMKGSEEVDPVVLTDVPGLRQYQKRLSGNKRNPFIQQDPNAESSGSGGGNVAANSSSSASPSTSSSTSTDTASSASSSTSSSTSGSTSTDTGSTGGTSTNPAPPEQKLVKYTIDVRVGPSGKTKVLKGVENLQLLPGDKRPVVQYVNTNDGATRAAFVVSPLVTSSDGDGKCDPGPNNCQFLFLEPGDVQTFVWGQKQETYRLELLAIHRELVPVKNATG